MADQSDWTQLLLGIGPTIMEEDSEIDKEEEVSEEVTTTTTTGKVHLLS